MENKLYEDPPSEKKRKSELRKDIGELWDKIDDLYDEIRAYTQAKTLKITQAALADEGDPKTNEEPKDSKFDFEKIDEILEKSKHARELKPKGEDKIIIPTTVP